MTTVIHLIRHGEVHNVDNIRYGQLPGFGLSRRGEAQAREAGRHLRALGSSVDTIISSPLERAIQTATLLELELGMRGFDRDDRLIEPPNQFDGRARNAQLYPWNWPKLHDPFTPSWGEPFADIARRMLDAIADHAGRQPGGTLVMVSHQSPIWIARLASEGRRGPPWLRRARCSHASVTSFEIVGDRYTNHRYWAPK